MSASASAKRMRLRHPEKQRVPPQPRPQRPDWLRVRAGVGARIEAMRALLRRHRLTTICEEGACPNLGTCWNKSHASFMILGGVCTRACAFCNVATGKPSGVDRGEPLRLAQTVRALGLRHVVVTSVDRDDLPDGGAAQFVACARALRANCPQTSLEFLIPDFRRKTGALAMVLADAPDVLNHNVETVPRLYRTMRAGADYAHSVSILAQAKTIRPELFTKSGLMLGLGESLDEVCAVMDDLRAANVDFLTLGQYLPPTARHARVQRFVPPDEFEALAVAARARGFLMVASSPLTRSSYHADEDFARLRAARADAMGAQAHPIPQ